MIPFARIVKYGNILETSKIRKITTDGSGVLMLTSTGKLYAAGTNTGGKYGSATTTPDTWTLIYENVDEFYNAPTWTFIRLKDGEYFCSGATAAFGKPASTGFVNCTSVFNAIVGTIIDIQVNALRNCITALTIEGELWSIGTNTQYIFGSSTPGSSTVFVKNTLVSNIKSFKTVYANIWALSKTGVLYGSGNPNAGQIPSSTGFVQIATDVIDYSAATSLICYSNASGVYARGNTNNSYGTNAPSTSTPVVCSLPFTYNPTTFSFPLFRTNSSTVAGKIIIKNGSDYYVSAVSDSYGFTSTNPNNAPGNVAQFTKMINAPTHDVIFYDSTYSSYYIDNDVFFVTGRLYPLPGYPTNLNTFVYREETIII